MVLALLHYPVDDKPSKKGLNSKCKLHLLHMYRGEKL